MLETADPLPLVTDDLPSDWAVRGFDDVVRSRARFHVGKVKREDYLPAGAYPVIDQGQSVVAGYWNGTADVYDGPLPVIVFGDHTRAFKFAERPFVCGADGTKILVPNTEQVDPLFLLFAFQHMDLPSRGYNRHFALLREQAVVCPPLPEQRAIAHVLRTVQRAKESTEAVIEAARELRRSMMRHLFTFGPVAVARVGEVELQETEIGMFPGSWSLYHFSDLVSIRSGQVDPKREPYASWLHVGPDDIEEAAGRLLYPLESAEESHLVSGKYAFQEGDVLYSKIRPYLRKATIADFQGLCSADMYALEPSSKVTAEYLKSWLLADGFTRQVVGLQQRVRMPKVNREQLNSTTLPVPARDVQVEIVRSLMAVEARIDAERSELKALDALFDSLLRNLMTARVRVPVGIGAG